MQAQLPKPPIPAGVDLHDFSFTPIFRSQLFRSAFHARATDAEWRAGVTLWLKSWDQMPAGSLPDNEVELCRLAELGRDQRTWKKVREVALHGWYPCDDGRLYHRVVAEGVMAAYMRRRSATDKGKSGAAKRWTLIDGGRSDSPGNAPAMQQPLNIDSPTNAPAIKTDSTGIARAMPGDSNRQGQGYETGTQTHPPQPLPEREGRVRGNGKSLQKPAWKPPTEEELLGTDIEGEKHANR